MFLDNAMERINRLILQGGRTGMTENQFFAAEIKEWKNSQRRKDQVMGDLYYEGQHDILQRQRTIIGENGQLQVVTNLPNNRLIDNQYALMVDQKTNYLVGKPFTLNCQDKGYTDALGKVFNKRFYRLLKYVCEDALNGGLGWLYPYYNEAGELSFKHFPAYDILPFWADDDHTILDCAIRYYTQEVWNGYQKEKVEKVEIFKADGIYRYIYQNDMLIADVEAGEHENYFMVEEEGQEPKGFNWTRIPLVPFKYNKQEIPLIRRVKTLQDGINTMISDFENTCYDNFFLSNEIEDQYQSHLDLQQFCTVDNNLTGVAGMVRKIHKYKATDGTEKLTMGNGNTKTIEAGYTEKEYRIQMAQNRFQYYDEEAMTDPMVITTGTRHAGTDMFNTVNADIFSAFNEATMTIVTTALGFDAFVDGAAMLNLENLEGVTIFGFVNPADMAKLRKALKDDLKYVEAYAKQGYVGTVGGINIYTKKNAETGKVVIATKEAVTLFNKKGTEVEQEREGNIRRNTVYSRKYYLAAMTNEAKAVKIITGSAAVTADTTVSSDKTYYAASGIGYVKVTPASGDNPKTKGWYEITAA